MYENASILFVPYVCREWQSLLKCAANYSFEKAVRRLPDGHYESAYMWVTQRRGDPTVRSVKALVRHALARDR
ncbi:MAG: hypothetical protein KatS3mg038_1176 [Candidatus Kapaibacterium sp.]|nr:MAG: hypothetical protein KatS3mg038_1176 [Candidatus Kapabacteria bacterium]